MSNELKKILKTIGAFISFVAAVVTIQAKINFEKVIIHLNFFQDKLFLYNIISVTILILLLLCLTHSLMKKKNKIHLTLRKTELIDRNLIYEKIKKIFTKSKISNLHTLNFLITIKGTLDYEESKIFRNILSDIERKYLREKLSHIERVNLKIFPKKNDDIFGIIIKDFPLPKTLSYKNSTFYN